jgi:nitrogen fixation NifU-like protein
MESTSVEDAGELLGEFRIAMRSRGETELDEDRFGDAIALNGVSRYVARVKCAMLPWVALEHALMGN